MVSSFAPAAPRQLDALIGQVCGRVTIPASGVLPAAVALATLAGTDLPGLTPAAHACAVQSLAAALLAAGVLPERLTDAQQALTPFLATSSDEAARVLIHRAFQDLGAETTFDADGAMCALEFRGHRMPFARVERVLAAIAPVVTPGSELLLEGSRGCYENTIDDPDLFAINADAEAQGFVRHGDRYRRRVGYVFEGGGMRQLSPEAYQERVDAYWSARYASRRRCD